MYSEGIKPAFFRLSASASWTEFVSLAPVVSTFYAGLSITLSVFP